MTRYLTFSMIVIFLLPVFYAAAADNAVEGKRVVVEREKRFLQQALHEIEASHKLAQEDVGELERRVDAINILEPGREDALQDQLDWYNRYLNWIADEQDEIEVELARLSVSGAVKEASVGRFDEMAVCGDYKRSKPGGVYEYESEGPKEKFSVSLPLSLLGGLGGFPLRVFPAENSHPCQS